MSMRVREKNNDWSRATQPIEVFGYETDRIFYDITYSNLPYHNKQHAFDVVRRIMQNAYAYEDLTGALLAAVFHDVGYIPGSPDNEERAVEACMEHVRYYSMFTRDNIDYACRLILETKDPTKRTPFNDADCHVLLHGSLLELIEYGKKIWTEYSFIDFNTYKEKHAEIVLSISDRPEVRAYLDWLRSETPSLAIYPGNFNPFHVGHADILAQASKVYDKVIVARGVNPDKNSEGASGSFSCTPGCVQGMPQTPGVLRFHNAAYECVDFTGLLPDLVGHYRKLGFVNPVVVRGLRNATDLENEKTQARILQDIDLNMLYHFILASADLEHVSSSAARALDALGKLNFYAVPPGMAV